MVFEQLTDEPRPIPLPECMLLEHGLRHPERFHHRLAARPTTRPDQPETVEPSARRMPEARVPFTITRSTSALVWYSTPNLRPAEIKASEMAWVPPIAIAAGSNDSTSDRLWGQALQPRCVVAEAAGRGGRGAHQQRAQLVGLEEVVGQRLQRHVGVHRLHPRIWDRAQRLHRIGRAIGRRRREAMRKAGFH